MEAFGPIGVGTEGLKGVRALERDEPKLAVTVRALGLPLALLCPRLAAGIPA